MKALRRLNESLPWLCLAILLYGLAVQLVGMWFVKDKIGYTIGLWYGVAIAIGMAINLARIVHDTFYFGQGSKKGAIAKSLLRYFVVVILFLALGYFKFGNLYTAIIGVFGLKVAAYLTPSLEKGLRKLTGREKPLPPKENENSENLNVKEVTM